MRCYFLVEGRASSGAGGGEALIEVCGLAKEFSATVAVAEVSFKVAAGEVFGLLGENGAGKTTTLRMLATLLRPTRGSARIGGFDLVEEAAGVRRLLGLVFEGGLYERLSARENIRYFGRLHGLEGSRLEERVEAVLAALAMTEYADRRTGKLSKGMRQKVVIARALVHDPPILLMDEPTAGLDITAARQVYAFIEQARRQGKTVVFSSHNMAEVERLCDRVAVMHRGRIVAEGTVAQLMGACGTDRFEDAFVRLLGEES